MKKIILTIALAASALGIVGCSNDYLNTDLESTINGSQLSQSSTGLTGIVDGIYTKMRSYGQAVSGSHEDFGHKAVLSALDLMSNDMVQTKSSWFVSYYNWTGRIQTSSRTKLIWNEYYPIIKSANSVINNVNISTADTATKQTLGQAQALRALSYFMLARVFGPTYKGHEGDLCVPIYTEATTEGKARAKVSEVYSLIVSDLKSAVANLDGYARPNKDKIDQSVAQAILAEVYLEMGNYADAATMAHKARQSYNLSSKDQYLGGFYDISTVNDAMWGATITSDNTTFVASFFSHFDNTNTSGYAGGLAIFKNIDRRLYEAIPLTDYRKQAFIGATKNPSYPTLPAYANIKFIDPTVNAGDYIYMRAAEMFYVEAEALARSGNEAQARKVLFDITSQRDSGYSLSTKTGQALLDEIILQKRIELWGEGTAFFDMKRLGVGLDRAYTGTNHPSFGQLKKAAGSTDFTFQIPQAEIDTNPNIVQNP